MELRLLFRKHETGILVLLFIARRCLGFGQFKRDLQSSVRMRHFKRKVLKMLRRLDVILIVIGPIEMCLLAVVRHHVFFFFAEASLADEITFIVIAGEEQCQMTVKLVFRI